ncbi:Copper-exporting P-type ATPase B [uncultured archaeon]|nr:Copper-exporting P-type ATPase B [uncultured archaeon]
MSEDFKAMDSLSALQHLGSDPSCGLPDSEALARMQKYGRNEIEEQKSSPLALFLKKFWGLTAWILEAIIILSYFSGKLFDVCIVSALLVLNAVIGFVQEQNAQRALEALRQKLQVRTRVLRSASWRTIPAAELVPGDIVRLRLGDFVPADVKVVSGTASADQSALTGESVPVEKKANDLLYSGSILARGEITGLVVLTGSSTFFGRTAQLVQIAKPKMHIEEIISKVIFYLLAITLGVLAITLVVSILRGDSLFGLLPLMLILLLGAVPVALPAMFTVSMALSARQLVQKGVLVTRLSAPDDAARMDILCVDKTGTLTKNEVAFAGVLPLRGVSETDVVLAGALASQEANHDAIDKAFIREAQKRNLPLSRYLQKSFTPFDPQTRRTEALVVSGSKRLRVLKGSLETLFALCKTSSTHRAQLQAYADECAQHGYRVLAVASEELRARPASSRSSARSRSSKLKLLGAVALFDPPRPESAGLVEKLRALGVSVKMLTGDALPVAREIATRVGITGKAIHASELKSSASMPASSKSLSLAESASVFAEIYPEDKYSIVRDLQARGHIVGMTGDGVNDAPALKQAEVGAAVSSATDVAKGAASLVLTQEGLSTILEPIRVGREMFQRIRTWMLNKITKTVMQVGFIVLAFFLTGQYIISSSAMLLLIFMIDFVTISLSTDNATGSSKPESWDIPALVRASLMLGTLLVAEAFGLFYFGLDHFHLSGAAVSTLSFAILFYFTTLLIFVVRERGRFWNSSPSLPLFSILLVDMALAAVFCVFGLFGLAPLPLELVGLVIGYCAFFTLAVNDWVKVRVLGQKVATAS